MLEERDLGPQPLEKLLQDWGLTHHNLVEASPEQLTHKQVQRACSGRRLTLKMKIKLARTLNFAIWGRLNNQEREGYFEYFPKHLFSYDKGYSSEFVDPNKGLFSEIPGRKLRNDFKAELGI